MTLNRLIFMVVSIWVSAALALWFFLPDWSSRGQFGDLFGSVNALFSGLAFAGLYSAFRLQQEQLVLQRKELELQREELKLQREEMAASRAELANQVAVQKALFKASVAQIAIASTQAQIEAIKMDSERFAVSSRTDHVRNIETLAKALYALSDKIEGEFGNAG